MQILCPDFLYSLLYLSLLCLLYSCGHRGSANNNHINIVLVKSPALFLFTLMTFLCVVSCAGADCSKQKAVSRFIALLCSTMMHSKPHFNSTSGLIPSTQIEPATYQLYVENVVTRRQDAKENWKKKLCKLLVSITMCTIS